MSTRYFTQSDKRAILERLEQDLNKIWDMYGERSSRYYNLERAFCEGYGVLQGYDSMIDIFREGRKWTANDDEFLRRENELWENFREKYFSAKGMRDPIKKDNGHRNLV